MPKQHRWTIKRHLDQANGNIENAITELVVTGQEFKDVHPDYYQAFCQVCAILEMAKQSINSLKDSV